jgi:uncharacterized membrane protein
MPDASPRPTTARDLGSQRLGARQVAIALAVGAVGGGVSSSIVGARFGVALASAAHARGGPQDARIALGLVSVALSWGVAHTVFTLRSAAVFYSPPRGGVDLPGNAPPVYADFASSRSPSG